MRRKTSRTKIDWDVQPLGMVSDQQIAATLGVQIMTVATQRHKRGISASAQLARARAIDWGGQPLGKMSDSQLARRLHVSVALVRQRRVARSIPVFTGTNPPPDAETDAEAQLGRVDDVLIAWKMGVAPITAARRRRAMCRPPAPAQPCPHCTRALAWSQLPRGRLGLRLTRRRAARAAAPSDLHQPPRARIKPSDWTGVALGKQPDEVVALAMGVSPSVVTKERRRRGIEPIGPAAHLKAIDWDALPLGKERDQDIAVQLGVSIDYVRKMRRARGIAPSQTSAAPKHIHWDSQPLGQVPDGVLAKRLGVTNSAVQQARVSRGIAASTPDKKKGIDWYAQPLGQVLDNLLVWKFGVTLSTVARVRKWRRRPAPSPVRCPGCRAALDVDVLAGLPLLVKQPSARKARR